MEFVKWTSRKFDFDFPAENFPFFIKRLKATAQHIEKIIEGLSKDVLTKKINNAWSIQEHIGHLIDLDELHEGRVNDYRKQEVTLRTADMTNQKTYDAHYNTRTISDLITEFRNKRNQLVSKLENLNPSQSSLHPRLQKQMRVADMAFFIAEHDDHHLMIIEKLLNK